jgi:hypothetical protein
MTSTPDAAVAGVDRLRAELVELGGLDAVPRPVPSTASRDWAASGAMSLTGSADGPPRLTPGAPASWVRAAVAVAGLDRLLPDPAALLGERAACAGLTRDTVGSAYRSLRTADGWLGLSLARDSDVALVPALVGSDVEADPWTAVSGWAAGVPTDEAEQRVRLLGLAGTAVGRPVTPLGRPGVHVHLGGPRVDRHRARPVVVDLSSLWAGPLCGHLLGLTGARVVKVESRSRPDGARNGPRNFYDLLHAGQESVALDLETEAGRRSLRELVGWADVVIEASRPRALAHMGIAATEHVAVGTVWVSITAYGRESGDRVGFGDDVAAAAGLVVDDGPGPYPVGDAIADPLAGVTAAAAAITALQGERGCLLDVSMRDVAAQAAGLPGGDATVVRTDEGWAVDGADGRTLVAGPRARPVTARATALGTHTERVLSEATGDRRSTA